MFLPVIVPLAIQRPVKNDSPPLYFIRESYLDVLTRYDLTPLLVPSTLSGDQIERLYKKSCGALFTGGGDFDARTYGIGNKNHPANSGIEESRDALELYLLEKILKDRKPFLGICRGAQALAIASGGFLHQHIYEEDHGEIHEAKTYAGAMQNLNTVLLCVPDTQAQRILGTKSLKVNCAHHQSVFQAGRNILVSGLSPAGVVEIIEHEDKNYFCMGIQSHPELTPDGPLKPLFKAFAKSVKKYAKNR